MTQFDNAPLRTLYMRPATWPQEHTELARPDPAVDGVLDRLVGAYHAAREVCAS